MLCDHLEPASTALTASPSRVRPVNAETSVDYRTTLGVDRSYPRGRCCGGVDADSRLKTKPVSYYNIDAPEHTDNTLVYLSIALRRKCDRVISERRKENIIAKEYHSLNEVPRSALG